MTGPNERGEGRLSTLIWLVVFAALIYAAWHVLPLYIDNYTFKDKMVEICRTPRGTNTDEKILDLLMKEVHERDLTPYVNRSSFRIQTGDTNRRISVGYEREAVVLPGWKKVIRFQNDVEQILLY